MHAARQASMRWFAAQLTLLTLIAMLCLALPAAAQTLAVAQIGPLAGPAASDTRDLSAGIQAHLAEVNARGGISGQQLTYFLLDDRYEAAEFERQFEAAMQRRPVAVLVPLGLNALRALLAAKLLDRFDTVVINLQLSAVPMQPAGVASRAAGAQAVLVMGAPPHIAQAVASLRQAGVSSMLFALSYLPTGLVVKRAGQDAARGVGIAQAFPNPMGHTLPLHRQFHAAMKAHAPTLAAFSSFHLEGYLTARVLTEALRRTPAPQSPAALAGALGSMGPLDLGGFCVHFDANRAGSSFVDIAVISANGRLVC